MTKGLLAATAALRSLMHFLAQQIQGRCGSSKPPSHVHNLPGREKSFHLTGLPHNIRSKAFHIVFALLRRRCLRFPSMTQRCHPSQAFRITVSPHVSQIRRLTTTSYSAASRCKPISAHALSVSAETQGYGNTSFDSTTCSVLMKRKSSPCGPYFPGTFQCVEALQRRTLSHGSK